MSERSERIGKHSALRDAVNCAPPARRAPEPQGEGVA